MNEPRPSPERDDAVIDELINAALDGLLDDAAADLGIPRTEAQRLVAGHQDRAAALRGARDLLATSPPLDDLTRRRLVVAALSAARPADAEASTRRRRVLASAGIAAALVVFAGIGALLVGRSNHSGDDTLAATRAGEQPAALEFSAAFGEVSDPAALRDVLRAEATPRAPAAEGLAGQPQKSEGTEQEGDALRSEAPGAEASDGIAGDAAPGGTTEAAPTAGGSGDCATLLAADFEGAGPPVLLATATFEGEPAGVLVLSDGDSRMAVVYSASDCTILMTQTLTTP